MALSDLIVRLRADTTDFTRKWADVQNQLNSAARQAVASTSGFRAFGDVLSRAGTAATAGLTVPLVGVGVAALRVAGNLESAQTAFTTILKSSTAAGAALRDLRKFALATPFEFPDLVSSSQRLLAFGVDAKQLIPTLRSIGNAVSSVGGGKAELDRVILAIGQIGAKGKLSAEEMNQLAETGLPVRDILAKSFGITTAQLVDMTQRGAVPADKAIRALLQGFDARFGGAMEAQSRTLQGIFSNLKDQVTDTLGSIGQALAPTAKRVAAEFVEPTLARLKELATGFAGLSPEMQNATLAFGAFGVVAGPFLLVLGQMTQGFAALTTVLRLVPFAAIAANALTFITSLQGSLIPALQGVRLTALGASVAIAGIGTAALAAAPALVELVSTWYQMRTAQADAAKAAQTVEDAIGATAIAIRQRGGDISALSSEYRRGQITQDQYARGLRDVLVALTNQQGPSQAAAESTKHNADQSLRLASATSAVTANPLPEWFTRVSETAGRAILALGPVGAAVANLIREEVFNRQQNAFRKLQEALTDFATAGEATGNKLDLDSDFIRFAVATDQFGTSLDSLTPRLDNVNARMIRLFDPTNASNLPLKSQTSQRLVDLFTNPFQQARIEQAGLRAEADRLGEVYTQVAAAAGGSSVIARRAYAEWTEAERRAAGVTELGGQRSARAFQEVSTILTNMNQRIAESIVNWRGFGETATGIAKQIETAIVAEIIQKLILTESRMNAISNALGRVLARIPGLGKVFGGGTIPTPGTVAGGAGTAAGSAGGTGSAAIQAATSGLQGALSLAFAGVSAVTGIIGNVLAFKTGKDTARLEVTARAIFAEVSNIRTDNWTQFNKGTAYLPAIAEAINRFGDAHGAYLSGILGTLQGGSRVVAADAGSGITINLTIQGSVVGTTVQQLADEVARALGRR